MVTKAKLPPVPEALAAAALVAAPTCAAAAEISISQWHELVRTGAAPRPVVRRPRFTRWAVADVREWLAKQARATDGEATAKVVATVARASAAAKAKRDAAAAR